MGKMDINLDAEFFHAGDEDGQYAKAMLYASAPYVLGVLRSNLQKSIGRGKGVSKSTGSLLSSLGLTKMSKDRNGFWNIKIGFGGKDENGTRNGLKAGVLEHGKSGQTARPFVKPTTRQVQGKVELLMQQALDEEMAKNGNT